MNVKTFLSSLVDCNDEKHKIHDLKITSAVDTESIYRQGDSINNKNERYLYVQLFS